MSITDLDALDSLCAAQGIAVSYHDIDYHLQTASVEVKCALLAAMDIEIRDDADIHAALARQDQMPWRSLVAPVLVYRQQSQILLLSLTLAPTQLGQLHWELREESGQLHQGSWNLDADAAVDQRELDGQVLRRFDLELDNHFESGYHQLNFRAADNSQASACLILAPQHCYQPELLQQRKVWGISLQLYALRSTRNWGIGDFTDLHNAIDQFAALGVSLIGLNPLHSLFSHLPENASPYSPSSRDFLNPVYLDIEAIAEFSQCKAAQKLVQSKKFQGELAGLRAQPLVDYSGVWKKKLTLLKLLYGTYLADADASRARAFRAYQDEAGNELANFALFEALQAYFYAADPGCASWQQWPEEFQQPGSASILQWSAAHASDIEFHAWLQWNAELQLTRASDHCSKLGLEIGLYRDLAIGNSSPSAQCWSEQSLYALEAGIGAPPDTVNSVGQNWTLPPLKPSAIADQNYRLFVQTLRANMRHAGALRIDHIMGLMRLYWVPEGYSAREGSYVSYPFEDLLGILALESQRNQCLVVGEDLGTVPDEVRHALYENKILSFRIFYFEKNWQQGSYQPPENYPRDALCCSGSHDLPTLKGFWQGSDLQLRDSLDLLPSKAFSEQLLQERERDRAAILAALAGENLIEESSIESHLQARELTPALALAIQSYLARSNSMVMMLQLEDLLLQADQINLPGTIEQYPNWRHKIATNLENWPESDELQQLARAIHINRGQTTIIYS